MNHYQFLNFSEGALWLIAAVILRKIVVIEEKRHSTACNIAIIGFVIFGVSDFLEGSLTRELHLWLWTLKISCGVIFLSARVCYLGRKNFKWTDRYLLFFTFCLTVAAGIIYITETLTTI
ncbi:MAG: hypothetical protein ACI9E1_002307 [Cryomorphaceae bacterium]|jgi:hypothetical protein